VPPRRDDGDHADAAVEGAPHLVVGDGAPLGEPVEDGGRSQLAASTVRGEAVRQHPRGRLPGRPPPVTWQNRVDLDLVDQREAVGRVDAGRLEQRLAERTVEPVAAREVEVADDAPDQAVAVAVRARTTAIATSTSPARTRSGPRMGPGRRRRPRTPRGRTRRRPSSPGCSAVSPPTSAQPASAQPSAMPRTRRRPGPGRACRRRRSR
jgi:hypothetical protein